MIEFELYERPSLSDRMWEACVEDPWAGCRTDQECFEEAAEQEALHQHSVHRPAQPGHVTTTPSSFRYLNSVIGSVSRRRTSPVGSCAGR